MRGFFWSGGSLIGTVLCCVTLGACETGPEAAHAENDDEETEDGGLQGPAAEPYSLVQGGCGWGGGDLDIQAPQSSSGPGLHVQAVDIARLGHDEHPERLTLSTSTGVLGVELGDGTGNFGVMSTYAMGVGPVSLATGDLDGDQRIDVAVANSDGANSAVSVRLGNADGTLSAGLLTSNLGGGAGPRRLRLADFDSDGVLDYVTANQSTGDMSIGLGNGDGTFATVLGNGLELVTVSGIVGPVDVATADFERDGDVDIVVVADKPYVYRNVNGEFSPNLTGLSRIENTTACVDGVAAGYVNTDGFPEFITSCSTTGNVQVWLNSGVKDYWAQANPMPTTVLTAGTSLAVGAGVKWLSLVDINRDDDRDVLATRPGGTTDSIAVVLGKGDGTFYPIEKLSTSVAPEQITAADVDHDGFAEILAGTDRRSNTALWSPTLCICAPGNDGCTSDESWELIVRFRADRSQADIDATVASVNGTIRRTIPTARTSLLSFPHGTNRAMVVTALKASGDVLAVSPNLYVQHNLQTNDPLLSEQNHLEQTQVIDAWDINVGTTEVLVGLVDSGADWAHPDLTSHWLNEDEFCANPPCNVGGWTFADPCPTGELGPVDGCPGNCNTDDDGDGLSDFRDPQVRAIWSNGVDNDGDGLIDEQGPVVNNVPTPCADVTAADLITAPAGQDCDGVRFDNDENGYLNDCKGWDFFVEDPPGDPGDNEPAQGDSWFNKHAIEVGGVLAAEPNNSIGVAGVHHNVRLIQIVQDESLFGSLDAIAYAVDNGAKLVNASWSFNCNNNSCSGGLVHTEELLLAALGRQAVLINAPDNGDDLAAYAPGTYQVPAMVPLPNVVVVGRVNGSDGYVVPNGPNHIDLSAPGQGTNCLNPTVYGTTWHDDDVCVLGYGAVSGTSVAAPQVAGVLGLIISHFDNGAANPFAGNPDRLIAQLLGSVDVLPALAGHSITAGRLNACKALGGCGAPATPVAHKRFVERTREQLPKALLDLPAQHSELFDADDDGDLDAVVVMCSHTDALSPPILLRNNGAGTFQLDEDAFPVTLRSQCGVTTGDFDGDGDVDVAAAGFGGAAPIAERRNRVYFNDGTGDFTDVSGTHLPNDTLPNRDVETCLIDNNNLPDLVFVGDGDVLVYLNIGGGFFVDGTNIWSPAFMPLLEAHDVACGDLTGDGRNDLFVTEQNGKTKLLVNQGNSFADETVARGIPNHTGSYARAVEFGDIDADSDLDIVIGFRDQDTQTQVLRNNNGNFVNATATFLPGIDDSEDVTSDVALADVDCDGDLDLMTINGDPNQGDPEALDPGFRSRNRLYVQQNGTFTDQSGAQGFSIYAYDVSVDAALGDVDDDGDLDVLMSNWYDQSALLLNYSTQMGATCP